MDEAARVAAETLGTDYCAVLEVAPDEERLVLRAGVGWKEGLVGHHPVATGVDSAAGFILRSDAPVIVRDLRQETRFAAPRVLLEHRVVSGMNVIIRGRAHPWGTIGVYTTHPRPFSADEVGFLQSVANVLALALERHEAEVVQRREKETLQTIFDNIPVMITVFDASGRIQHANREWVRTLGWTVDEARQVDVIAECYPDPEARARAREFTRRSERRWADFQVRTRDGRVIEKSWARFALSDGSIGFGVDITERKQGEQALRESEARFRQLAENINEVFWLGAVNTGEILYVSPAYAQVFGRSCESLYREPRSWLEAVHPEDRERIWRLVNEQRSRRELDETYRLVRNDGSIRWVRARTFPIRNACGKAYRYAGVAEDVTDRVRAEEERARLLESETSARAQAEAALERLRSIQSITDSALVHLALDELLRELLHRLRLALEADGAIVFLVDDERNILCPRAVDGWAEADRIASLRVPFGKGASGRVAAEGRPLIFDGMEDIDLSGIEGMSPDEIRAIAQSTVGAPLRSGNKVIGVVAVTSARPRRFTNEDLKLLLLVADRVGPAVERARLVETVHAGRDRLRTLSRRLLKAEEDERRRIAVELHDDLGQLLTAAKINMESAERMSGMTGPHYLKEAINHVDQAMRRVRDMALALRPSVLDDLGLAAALRWYVDQFARKAQIEMHLSIDAVSNLESGLETSCFRLAQEALTNVARHAQARQVWFDLHQLGTGLELSVRDDGIGFDAPAARARAIRGASLGLLGMEERVALVGGELELLSEPGRGTQVRARFPVGEKEHSTT